MNDKVSEEQCLTGTSGGRRIFWKMSDDFVLECGQPTRFRSNKRSPGVVFVDAALQRPIDALFSAIAEYLGGA
jgi:hypothetical protein